MEKLRIAILTLYYGNNNYGGLAQAWALAYFLNSKGFSAEVISYKKGVGKKGTLKDRMEQHGLSTGKTGISHSISYIFQVLSDKYLNQKLRKKRLEAYKGEMRQRHALFEEYRNNIPHSILYTEDTISDASTKYDVFVSGSDQIWKPGVIQDAFVLKFASTGKKKISYATSIAVGNIASRGWFCRYLKENLKDYSALSVREEQTCKELSEVLGREVEWVADPTMLVDKDVWKEQCSPRRIAKKYVFVYFLGDGTDERNYVVEYAKKKGLKIATLPFAGGHYAKADVDFGDNRLFDVGVNDFFSLIRYSECVFTDSFHAVCFSRVFEKEFFVLDRFETGNAERMTSRIESVLKLMGLRERFVNRHDDLDAIKTIDYQTVEKRLAPFIEKSKKFLMESIRK